VSDFVPYPSNASQSLPPTDRRASSRPGNLRGAFVVVDPGFAATLHSQHELQLEVQTRKGDEFTRDLPNVGEEALAALDERGLVKVGTHVKSGDLLVGRVRPKAGLPASPEEKLLRAIFGEKAGDVADVSLRVPGWTEGEVKRAVLESDRAEVTLGWSRPLEVGDVLELDGVTHVVAAIRPLGGVDLEGGAGGAVRVTKKVVARDELFARHIGPYDLDTLLPTEGRARWGGQRVHGEALSVVAARAPWVAWEWLSVKSDAVLGRTRAYESLVKRENVAADALRAPEPPPSPSPAPKPAAGGGMRDIFSFFETPKSAEEGYRPEAVEEAVLGLRALGLSLTLTPRDATVAVLDDEGLVEATVGAVRKVEELQSEKIFGPLRDYECQCGKYKRMAHRGIVCEVCGVEVIQSKVRRERLGRLELPVPVTHPLTGQTVEVLGVLPADRRRKGSATGDALDAAYAQVLEEGAGPGLQMAVGAVCALHARAVNEAWVRAFDKPVDASGTAHLVADPSVSRRTCRAPRAVLLELFRPRIYGLLEEQGLVTTIKSAKRLVDQQRPEAWRALDAVVAQVPLLLVGVRGAVGARAEAWDSPAVAVDEGTAAVLGKGPVALHVPYSTQAVLEVEAWTEALSFAGAPRPESLGGWLGPTDDLVGRVLSSVGKSGLADALTSVACGRYPPSPAAEVLRAWEEKCAEAQRAVALVEAAPPAAQAMASLDEVLARSVDELEMSVRTANGLQQAGIKTIGELCSRTEADLLKTKNFGLKSLKEVKELLADMGLSLGSR